MSGGDHFRLVMEVYGDNFDGVQLRDKLSEIYELTAMSWERDSLEVTSFANFNRTFIPSGPITITIEGRTHVWWRHDR